MVAVKNAGAFELLAESGGKPVTLQANAARWNCIATQARRNGPWIWRGAVLPLLCYLVGSFAFVTMLMKTISWTTSLQITKTAIAKGVLFSQAVRRHVQHLILGDHGHQITLFVR